MELYKRGNCFRINTSLAGLSVKGIPRVLKGNISFILKFDDKTGIINITIFYIIFNITIYKKYL